MSDTRTQPRYLVAVSGTITGWDKPQEKLAKAFKESQFILFSQSIVKLAAKGDKRPHYEVFVRLQEEEQNLVPPGTFLPFLQHFDLGPQLDRYVVRKLLTWYRMVQPEKWGIAHLNICNETWADPNFGAFIKEELKRNQIGGDFLCFEFPGEQAAQAPGAISMAQGLIKSGCQISVGAMDDGGIPFGPIKDLGATFLKIGGRLVQELAHDKVVAAEVKTAAHACRSFGVHTIAQHVEDAPTLSLLRKLEVTFAQGYGISRPGPLGNPAKL